MTTTVLMKKIYPKTKFPYLVNCTEFNKRALCCGDLLWILTANNFILLSFAISFFCPRSVVWPPDSQFSSLQWTPYGFESFTSIKLGIQWIGEEDFRSLPNFPTSQVAKKGKKRKKLKRKKFGCSRLPRANIHTHSLSIDGGKSLVQSFFLLSSW